MEAFDPEVGRYIIRRRVPTEGFVMTPEGCAATQKSVSLPHHEVIVHVCGYLDCCAGPCMFGLLGEVGDDE